MKPTYKSPRRRFIDILGELPIERIPIRYSKVRQTMTVLFPHLTEHQRRTVFGKFLEWDEDIHVAVPAVFVRDTVEVVSLCVGRKLPSERIFQPPSIRLGSPIRVKEYLMGSASQREILYIREAIRYAETHWLKSLILDNWVGYIQIHLKETLSSIEAKPVAAIHLATARKWEEIVSDHSYPSSLVFNGDIIKATLNEIEGYELRGNREPKELYNCACCGSGVNSEGCEICGGHGVDEYYSGKIVLPPNIMALLFDSGYLLNEERLFAAQENEYSEWKRRHSQLFL